MRVGNLGLGTYPSQILRLLYYFLHGSIKISPTVANQYSSWTNRELWGIAIEKWHSRCRKIMKFPNIEVLIMKSTFYCTKMEQKKSIKMLKIWFEYITTRKRSKNGHKHFSDLRWPIPVDKSTKTIWIFHLCHFF